MTAPTLPSAVDAYVDDVRDALADLPLEDRDDLLEDLRGHLAELVSEEPGVDLVARLGRPEAYALELRTAAGLPATSPTAHPVRTRLRELGALSLETVRATSVGRAVVEFVPTLRPAWWVVRAVAALYLVAAFFNPYAADDAVIPAVSQSMGSSALVLLAAVVASVAVGRSARSRRRPWSIALVGLNVVLAGATVAYAVELGSPSQSDSSTPTPLGYCCTSGGLYREGGAPITNLYGYDADGRPIDRVQLFDQDGQPVDITTNDPGFTQQLHNVYPQQLVQPDPIVVPDLPAVPDAVVPAPEVPALSPVATPSASPAATPRAVTPTQPTAPSSPAGPVAPATPR